MFDDPSSNAGRPLAVRMRPRALEEFVGQTHLLAEGSALRTAIEQGRPHSMVLYGPPGSGKTTLARMVAEHSQAAFEELSAVQAGRAEVRAVIERAEHRRSLAPGDAASGRTVLFLDEIHRFNKAQQDALLPAVEEGLLTLIGATTENPAFEVNGALLSRVRVYALQALSADEVADAAAPRGRGEIGRRGRDRVPRRAQRRRRAHGAQRARARAETVAEAALQDGEPEAGASRSHASRTRCSGALCSTTKAAIATTTTPRPGSRRRAARTRTPRCTTSP